MDCKKEWTKKKNQYKNTEIICTRGVSQHVLVKVFTKAFTVILISVYIEIQPNQFRDKHQNDKVQRFI